MPAIDFSQALKSDLAKLAELTEARGTAQSVRLKEGERREVTILFLDLKGFTAMSEKLDPEDVQLIIDHCFKILSSEVEKYHGYVDKYEGDRLMALFGSREATEHDCERALRAALGMREKFREINRILAGRSIEIGIRIGVNTGLVVTGRIGVGRDKDFTVMGDVVNLASRLESHAPSGEILVSENVVKAAGEAFLFESMGEIAVKGKLRPIAVFTVAGVNLDRTERWDRSPFTRRSPLVSREAELSALRAMAQRLVSSGAGFATFALCAPAGLGKSRLIHEFLGEIRENPSLLPSIFRAGAASLSADPFALFVDLARRGLESLGAQGGRRDEGASALEVLAGLSPAEEREAALDPSALKLERQASARLLIERMAEAGKASGKRLLVLALEDLHWADSASIEGLEFLGENLNASLPMLFLWSYRPEFSPTAQLCSAFSVFEARLDPLSEEGCASILESALGEAPFSAGERDLLIRRSGGNPLFLEELIQTLIDDGVLSFDGMRWNLTRPVEESRLPAGIQRILLARFDMLDGDLKAVLAAASVIGETVPVVLLDSVCEGLALSQSEVGRRLMRLAEAGFVYRCSEPGLSGPEVSFRHALMRDVVYSTLLNHNKTILHERAGRSYESLYGDRRDEHAALLYGHFAQAGAAEETLKYGFIAVDRLVRRCASVEGFRIIADLRQRLPALLDGVELCRAQAKLTEAEISLFDLLGRRPEQEDKILELERMRDAFLEAKLDARVALARALYGCAVGEFAQAREYAESGLAFMGDHGRVSKLRMDLLRSLGVACYSTGEHAKALYCYEQGLSLASELGERGAEAAFLNAVGLVRFNMGHSEAALSYYRKAHAIYDGIGDRRGAGNALGNEGLVHWTLGDYSRALDVLKESHNRFREIGFKKGQAVTLGNIGVIVHKLGLYDEALDHYERALVLRREIRDRAGEGYDLVNIGEVHLHLGRFDEAEASFRAGREVACEVGSAYLLAENLNSLGVVYRTRGDGDVRALEESDRLFAEALALSERHGLIAGKVKALSGRARTVFMLGDKDRAFELSSAAMRIVADNPAAAEGAEEEAYINHYHILGASGREGEAREALCALVNIIEARGARIREERFRLSFLENVRQNRFALAEWRKTAP